jgi:hypothetical protein
MPCVYTAADLTMVGHLRNLLEQSGIPCYLRNDLGAGELPPIESWPELWLENEADAPQAQAIIESALHDPPAQLASWTCPRCGELLEGQFTECWSCGASRAE